MLLTQLSAKDVRKHSVTHTGGPMALSYATAWDELRMRRLMSAAFKVLFLVFGSFFGAFGWLGAYWPLLLVGAGLLILVEGLVKR